MNREHCTVVFADVSGSTRLFEGLGDEHARKIIQHVLYSCASVIAQHEGQVIKTIGDEVMATFPGADLAVLAAIGIQRWAQDDRTMCEQGLGLRVGLHHGHVLAENNDVFGSTVNTAARMVTLAGSGQIVTSSSTRDALKKSLRERCRALGATHIPGRDDALDIISVIWEQDTSNLTAVPTSPAVEHASVRRQLVLSRGGQCVTLSEDCAPVALGRDPECGIVIQGDCVSRHHARIEFRHGFFVLVDQSTNGTWLAVDRQSSILVHRGELPLLRDGTLALGRPLFQDHGLSLVYRLEDA